MNGFGYRERTYGCPAAGNTQTSNSANPTGPVAIPIEETTIEQAAMSCLKDMYIGCASFNVNFGVSRPLFFKVPVTEGTSSTPGRCFDLVAPSNLNGGTACFGNRPNFVTQYEHCNDYSLSGKKRYCNDRHQNMPIPGCDGGLGVTALTCTDPNSGFTGCHVCPECQGSTKCTAALVDGNVDLAGCSASSSPTVTPTSQPTNAPSTSPTDHPTNSPTTSAPTESPTISPTTSPTTSPTLNPTATPTRQPVASSCFPLSHGTEVPGDGSLFFPDAAMTFVQKIKSGDVCTGSACCGLIFCPEFSLQDERPYHSIFFHARVAVCAASFDPSTESGFTSECDLCECYNINTCHRDDNKVHSETEYMSIAAEINYAINTGYVLLLLFCWCIYI